MKLDATYILPIRRAQIGDVSELTEYLRWLHTVVELIVVDGSPPDVFCYHAVVWHDIIHVAPSESRLCANGKVAGVMTGLDMAQNERVVIADDDVRYDIVSLLRVVGLLESAAVVRPQNYFSPMPWHAAWDTARSLLARSTGGDWPGTLAVRRSSLDSSQGYDGSCLFENLELVRTVVAAGGREHVARDLYVRRLPPTVKHFLSQRIRQAYDEFARPERMAIQLSLLPVTTVLAWKKPRALLAVALLSVVVAELGRRRDGGDIVFPAITSLFAPAWLAERMLSAWIAVFYRLSNGGVPYTGGILTKAASSPASLRAKLGSGSAE